MTGVGMEGHETTIPDFSFDRRLSGIQSFIKHTSPSLQQIWLVDSKRPRSSVPNKQTVHMSQKAQGEESHHIQIIQDTVLSRLHFQPIIESTQMLYRECDESIEMPLHSVRINDVTTPSTPMDAATSRHKLRM